MRADGRIRIATTLVLCVLVAGCGYRDRDPKLLQLKSSTQGPDEFSILPTKPLEAPKSFAALPAPTPGGRNLADPTPDEDTVAALGGNPSVLGRQGIPAADGALIAHTTRNGVQSGIREQLAAEDLQYRRDNDGRLLERLFKVNVYFKAYRQQELDQHRELARLRRAGIKTPSAPPDPAR
jgi:hypothetical protein